MKKFLLYLLLITIFFIVGLFLIFFRFDIPIGKIIEEYADAQSQFITIQGIKVHYKSEGKGVPLVLIHGTSSSLHTWDGWTKELKSNFRVIRMDLPAFGLTGPAWNGEYTTEKYVQFIKDFLDQLGIDTCYMAGNSFGGHLTWRFAQKYPKRVLKMILISASGYPISKPLPITFRIVKFPLINSIFRYFTPKFIIKKNLEEVFGDDTKISNAMINRYYKLLLREGNRMAFIDRVELLAENDLEYKRIGSITIPTLIQWGDKDFWVPLSDGRKFDNDLPDSTLIIYNGVGHIAMEEIPKQTALDVYDFLKK